MAAARMSWLGGLGPERPPVPRLRRPALPHRPGPDKGGGGGFQGNRLGAIALVSRSASGAGSHIRDFGFRSALCSSGHSSPRTRSAGALFGRKAHRACHAASPCRRPQDNR
ncbi:hypothetical protein EOE48_21920 [Methylobacterium oryzihabitans]|uniref:Uncharacterized protein n=1 Tax=Methylobacterium oryzihabitans TaxID=2499852 RepID=A0A437NXJ6_9HYPH|nr:hypothetical protein EOE48_21920 [Methylobacterium oryzihabitans]